MCKAVFWDRDGVLNHCVTRGTNITAPWDIDEFVIYEGAYEALQLTHKKGFLNFVVTNQPDAKRGLMARSTLNRFHRMLIENFPITNILYAEDKESIDYKPNPGMLEYLIDCYKIEKNKSFMVGDRWKDIVAGYRAGVRTVFVDRNELQTYPQEFQHIEPTYHVYDTLQAAKTIGSLING